MADTYPRNRFKAVDEDLLCCLCNGVPKTPLMASCQHICCPGCIEGWSTCPQCGHELRPGESSPPGRIIQNLYSKLEMMCEFRGRGCEVRFPFGNAQEMAEHSAKCPKAPCACPHEGCSYTGVRENMAEHEAVCELRLVYCELCSMAVKFNAVSAHRNSICPMAEMECTCGHKMRRADKEQHYGRGCPHRVPVGCPVIGCGRSVPQNELDAHITSTLSTHLQLMSVAMQERDGALQRLTEEAQRTLKKLQEAEDKVTALEAEKRELRWYGMGLWRTEPDGRSVWTIGNVTQKLKEASLRQHAAAQAHVYLPLLIWSPQSYTHPSGGYRFSLRLDLGNSANVGLFVHLHEGDHDDQLPWPFNLDYTVQLGPIVSQITQRDSYMHYTSQGRPPHELSWGWANFCPLEAFKEAVSQDALDISVWFHTSTTPAPNAAPAVTPQGATAPYPPHYPSQPPPPQQQGRKVSGHSPQPMGYGGPLPSY